MNNCRVILFKCQWFDIHNKKNGIHNDGYFTSINVSRSWYQNDPFVLAKQATQVFYLNDTRLGKNWLVVQKFQPRHVYDIPEKHDIVSENDEIYATNEEVYQESELVRITSPIHVEGFEIEGRLSRDDVVPDVIDVDAVRLNKMNVPNDVNNFIQDDYVDNDDTINEHDEETNTYSSDDPSDENDDI